MRFRETFSRYIQHVIRHLFLFYNVLLAVCYITTDPLLLIDDDLIFHGD